MRKHLFGIVLIALSMISAAVAAEDPFTGTWQNKNPDLVLAPARGGISIKIGTGKPEAVPYGKDTLRDNGYTTNTVRIDSRTLKSTVSRNGEVQSNDTGTVSADGKHYTIAKDYSGGSKGTEEYDRIGPVPSGDLFFGSWKQVSPITRSRTVEADGDSFKWTGPGPLNPGLTGKFDGKGYQGRGFLSLYTYRLKRIDNHTIEIAGRMSPPETRPVWAANISPEEAASSESKEIWQVKGDILTITSQDPDGDQSGPIVEEFERMK